MKDFKPDKYQTTRKNKRRKHRENGLPFHVYYYPDLFRLFIFFNKKEPQKTSFIGVNFNIPTNPKQFFDKLQELLGVGVTFYPGVIEMYNARFSEKIELDELNRVLKTISETSP